MRRLALALVLCHAGCGPGASSGPTVADRTGTGSSGANANGNGTTSSGPAVTSSSSATITAGSAPVVFTGTAGGPYSSSVIGAGSLCTGYMGALPSHVLDVTEDLANLTFAGEATSDTVIFVRTPTGEMLCDDDGGGYPNPFLSHVAPAGRYQIWYATYSPGESIPYTLTVTARPAVSWAGVPGYCGLTAPVYGPITIGSRVVLGAHTGWTGPDGTGGSVTDYTWWAPEMAGYVGMTATVTTLGGLDPAGCPYVRVDVDGGAWGWRIRDMSPPP